MFLNCVLLLVTLFRLDTIKDKRFNAEIKKLLENKKNSIFSLELKTEYILLRCKQNKLYMNRSVVNTYWWWRILQLRKS